MTDHIAKEEQKNVIRCRGYTFTINNWKWRHVYQLTDLYEIGFANYIVFGWEIGEVNHIPHLQGYMHFPNPRRMSEVHNYIDGLALKVPKAKGDKFSHRWTYCFKGEQPKDEWNREHMDGPNFGLNADVYELGSKPINDGGKAKKEGATDLVIKAIREGKTQNEIRDLFPSFYLYHKSKIQEWFDDEVTRKQLDTTTKFFVVSTTDNPLKKVLGCHPGIYDEITMSNLAVIHDLGEIEAYPTYDHVLFITDMSMFDNKFYLYPQGVPITYKKGYQYKTMKCKTFTIAVRDYKKYVTSGYKILSRRKSESRDEELSDYEFVEESDDSNDDDELVIDNSPFKIHSPTNKPERVIHDYRDGKKQITKLKTTPLIDLTAPTVDNRLIRCLTPHLCKNKCTGRCWD